MPRKRRNTSSPEPDNDVSSSKRRLAPEAGSGEDDAINQDRRETPYVDEFTGQTGAFPGLGGGDEMFYGPASDGVDYLRMVRSEAKGVPHILTTSTAVPQGQAKDTDEIPIEGGYYYDGAYTARSDASTTFEVSDHPPLAQTRYYESLLVQFRLLQATLRCSPPLPAVEALRPGQFISFPENTHRVRQQWEAHMLSTDPHPVQLACMASDTVLELVKFLVLKLEKMLRMKDQVKVARTGAWVWAILGRCQDQGELVSEEIGDLRELAQLALRLESGVETRGADEEWGGNGVKDVSAGDHVDKIKASGKSLSGTSEEMTVEQMGEEDAKGQELISTTLEMIVTIVGEVYGQRDLLDLRKKWPDVN